MKGKSKSTRSAPIVTPPLPLATDYEFVLKPQRSDCYFYEEVNLSLYPQFNKKRKTYLNIWPQVYGEGKDYMPFFVLQTDRESLLKRQAQYKQSQNQRLFNAIESKNQMLMPHPGKTRHTCFVCKSHFTDYKTHVQSKAHKAKLRTSRSQSIIRDLILAVQDENKQEPTLVISEEQPKESFSKPTKKLLNEWKLRDMQIDMVSNANEFDDGEEIEFLLIDLDAQNDLEELKFKQPTEPSLNKHQENQTLLNCYNTNLQSFRVSDYLI